MTTNQQPTAVPFTLLVPVQLHPDLLNAAQTLNRIQRWGTCAGCPVHDGVVLPEKCVDTDRHDHQMTLSDLLEANKRYWKAEHRQQQHR